MYINQRCGFFSIEDGAKKQDCKFNAAKRLVPNIAKRHKHLDIVYVGDGLFSKMPFASLVEKHGNCYVLKNHGYHMEHNFGHGKKI